MGQDPPYNHFIILSGYDKYAIIQEGRISDRYRNGNYYKMVSLKMGMLMGYSMCKKKRSNE